MALDLSSLSAWSDTDSTLSLKAITKNRFTSIPGIHIIDNVMGDILAHSAYISPQFVGTTCNSTNSGTTSFLTRNVTTCLAAGYQTLCQDSFDSTSLSKFKNGSMNALPFEDQIALMYQAAWEEFVEDQAINGTTSGYKNIGCSGVLAVLAANTASTVNVTGTAITNSNAVAIFDAVLAVRPKACKDREAVVVCSYAGFDALMINLRNNNWFDKNKQTEEYVYKLDGYTNVTVRGIASMPTNRIWTTYPQNIIFAYNLNEGIKMAYSEKDDHYWMRSKHRQGVNFFSYDHVVRTTID